MINSKKVILGAFDGSFETYRRNFEKKKKFSGQQTLKRMTEFKNYTRYSWVDDKNFLKRGVLMVVFEKSC